MQNTKDMMILVTGPTGVGKDTIIGNLVRIDSSLVWTPKYTNRLLRTNEQGRINASDEEIARLETEGKVFVVLNRFGVKIAEPISEMHDVIKKGLVPITDYNIREVSDFKARIGVKVFNVYIMPPSIEEWRRRLETSGRSDRFEVDIKELEDVKSGRFSKEIDLTVVNYEVASTARAIAIVINNARRPSYTV